AAREPRLNATFIVEGAKAELHARRYDRARSLLVGQPWLEDYAGGEALAVLAEAEARLGLATSAGHYAAARARATGVRAALLAVREGLAWEVAGERDSAAAAYAAARGRVSRRSIRGCGSVRRGSRATRRRPSACSRTCRPPRRGRPAPRGPRRCSRRVTPPPRSRPWPRRGARSTSRGWPGPWATRVVRATPCTRSWRGRPSRTTPRPRSASRSPGWRRARLRSMSRSRAR